jgi:hypothetical protein
MKKCQTGFEDNFEVIQWQIYYIIFVTTSIKKPKKKWGQSVWASNL